MKEALTKLASEASNSRPQRTVQALLCNGVMLFVLQALTASEAIAQSSCQIPNSPCYPWHIASGRQTTVLLEIIPNNAVTSATYRICLCAPEKSVVLVFWFEDKEVTLGQVETGKANARCRDFRIETSHRSRLLLRRPSKGQDALQGCYTSIPNLP